jgi:glutathione S-transferase
MRRELHAAAAQPIAQAMTDLSTLPILHHYPSSPFSEKVRLAFGLKGASWGSVEIPVVMPKPDLTPMTGGYRRTPVLQIGADLYCDTALIMRTLERRVAGPTLTPPGQEGLASMVAMWADRTFFAVTVPIIFGAEGFHVPEVFKQDREKLSGRPFDVAVMRQMSPLMRDQYRAQLGWIETQLAASPSGWLLGDKPGLIDITAWMNLWFLRAAFRPAFDALVAPFEKVEAWATRVEAIGHGTPQAMTGAEALEIAKSTEPEPRTGVDPREPQGLRAGDFVNVMPDDYGRDPVSGTVVYADDQEIAVRRETPDLGHLVVHFPRAGYLVRRS